MPSSLLFSLSFKLHKLLELSSIRNTSAKWWEKTKPVTHILPRTFPFGLVPLMDKPVWKEDDGKAYDIVVYLFLNEIYKSTQFKANDDFNPRNFKVESCRLYKVLNCQNYKGVNVEETDFNMEEHLRCYNISEKRDNIRFYIYQLDSEKKNIVLEYLENNPDRAIRLLITLEPRHGETIETSYIKTKFMKLSLDRKNFEFLDVEIEKQTK
ncbi:hypothetical protein CDIK_1987 [Cucumispora dikerogammari]|nr:hypothetical protein CDIK_1987 [Cucumispora dikerogammari]